MEAALAKEDVDYWQSPMVLGCISYLEISRTKKQSWKLNFNPIICFLNSNEKGLQKPSNEEIVTK